jgi:hypothetical protein
VARVFRDCRGQGFQSCCGQGFQSCLGQVLSGIAVISGTAVARVFRNCSGQDFQGSRGQGFSGIAVAKGFQGCRRARDFRVVPRLFRITVDKPIRILLQR